MDEIDERILRELQVDGRISNADLAKKINLSASATLRRVQELERLGVIKGYRVVLDPHAMEAGFAAYVTVGLSDHSKAAQVEFERSMLAAAPVRECYNITGTFEYLLRIEVKDLATYKEFHTEVLGQAPFVRSITSYIVMESVKNLRA